MNEILLCGPNPSPSRPELCPLANETRLRSIWRPVQAPTARRNALAVMALNSALLNWIFFCKVGHSATRHQNTQYNYVTHLKISKIVQKQWPCVSTRCPCCVSLMFLTNYSQHTERLTVPQRSNVITFKILY